MSNTTRYYCIASAFLVAGIAAVVILIHDRYERSRCGGMLKLLGNAIQTYRGDNLGDLPPQLAALSNELSNPAFLICPGSGNAPGDLQNATAWADYRYVDWFTISGTNVVPGNFPIAYDRSMSNHGGDGINVLTVDGSVRWEPKGERLKKFSDAHPSAKLQIPE